MNPLSRWIPKRLFSRLLLLFQGIILVFMLLLGWMGGGRHSQDPADKAQMDAVITGVETYGKAFLHYAELEKKRAESLSRVREAAATVNTSVDAVVRGAKVRAMPSCPDSIRLQSWRHLPPALG